MFLCVNKKTRAKARACPEGPVMGSEAPFLLFFIIIRFYISDIQIISLFNLISLIILMNLIIILIINLFFI